MRNGEVIERPVDHRTLTKRYTEEAVRFIDASRTRPFFLYLAHSLPHIPLARSDEFVGHSAGGIYGDVVEEIDWSAGRIIDALRAAGIDDDAGPVHQRQRAVAAVQTHGGSAGPLQEGKGTTWEGGVRTPAIFWWPGTIRPGVSRTSGRPSICSSTAASARRRRRCRPTGIDGVDLSAALHGSGSEPAQRAVLLLGQRAAGGSQGRTTRRTSSPAARMASGEPRTEHVRRCCSTSRRIRASGSTSPPPTRTSWPISSRRPRRIGERWCDQAAVRRR